LRGDLRLVQETDQERKCPSERPGIPRRGHEFAEIVAVISGHDEQAGVRDTGG
jgi:hypothetical protein